MLAGVFVGGAATRMGGIAKGLLVAPGGEPIVVRTCRLLAALHVPCVLVGRHEAYVEVCTLLGVRALADRPTGIGPLGGLIALLHAARGGTAIALGGDMPYITAATIEQLCAAPPAGAVAPRIDGRWQTLFARYDASRALPVAIRRAADGQLALQGLLDELGAQELPLPNDALAALRDWDVPADVEQR